MAPKGDKFEKLTREFAGELFKRMGYQVNRVRKQWAGTQYGFDVRVVFLDDNDLEREICMECKDYSNKVEWKQLVDKLVQVHASPYDPTAFIGISPHSDISNVNDASWKGLEKTFKFPIALWCPDSKVREIFAIVPEIFKEIYGEDTDSSIDIDSKIKEVKWKGSIHRSLFHLTNKGSIHRSVFG